MKIFGYQFLSNYRAYLVITGSVESGVLNVCWNLSFYFYFCLCAHFLGTFFLAFNKLRYVNFLLNEYDDDDDDDDGTQLNSTQQEITDADVKHL